MCVPLYRSLAGTCYYYYSVIINMFCATDLHHRDALDAAIILYAVANIIICERVYATKYFR